MDVEIGTFGEIPIVDRYSRGSEERIRPACGITIFLWVF